MTAHDLASQTLWAVTDRPYKREQREFTAYLKIDFSSMA